MSNRAMVEHPTCQLCLALAAFIILVGCVVDKHPLRPSPYQSWAAYYSDEAKPEAFSGYDVVVFDADRHPDIATVKAQGSQVLAYISLAEIADYRSYAKRFAGQQDQVMGINDAWKSKIIDIRREDWQQFITEEWLPLVMSKGFDGVFIDTTDTALAWQQKGDQYRGMDEAVVKIVAGLRAKMSREKLIMINRGFAILPQIAKQVDIVLAESILIDAKSEKRTYFPPHIYQYYVDELQGLRQKHSHLSIFTLDYPQTIDKTAWLHVCRKQKKWGFVPYISTLNLQQINAPLVRCH